MKKKTYLILFLLVCVFAVSSDAQHLPVLNVPSPDVSGLGEYGRIPVGLYTGVPDISVPLHELKAGHYSFPLAAKYHLASVKPQVPEGCLGMGWSLHAGGYISRKVNGVYDEKMHTDGHAPGFYAQGYRLAGMSNEEFHQATQQILPSDGSPFYELSADEFSFNFFGHTGTFYCDGSGGWQVISDEDIRVEFDSATGFVDLRGLRPEIQPGSWGAQSRNNRFFNRFTLITPDGCRYEFGGIYATEYSISYYNRQNADLIPTTWQLSRIMTPQGHTVSYTYEAVDLQCDLRYVPSKREPNQVYCSASPVHTIGREAMVGFLLMPVRLKSIETPIETVSFDYWQELDNGSRFEGNMLAWKAPSQFSSSIYHSNRLMHYDRFLAFMGNGLDLTDDKTLQKSISKKLTNSVLHRLVLFNKRDKKIQQTIYFDYSFSNRRKVSRILSTGVVQSLIPKYAEAPGGFKVFARYIVPTFDFMRWDWKYHFTYYDQEYLPYNYMAGETDYWGYYAGRLVSFSDYPDFKKPIPSLRYTKAGVLASITYPTGGSSHFTYELHQYGQAVDENRTCLLDKSGVAGGLRVSTVSRYDADNTFLDCKKYHYSEELNGRKSSGVLSMLPTYEVSYNLSSGESIKQTSEGGFFPFVSNNNAPVVGYSCVIEETQDSTGKCLGYVRHRFSNFDADLYGDAYLDEPLLYANVKGQSPVLPYTSLSLNRGKPLSEEHFSADGRLIKQQVKHYKEVNPGSFKHAHQYIVYFCSDPISPLWGCVGILTKVYTHSFLVDSITVAEYPSEGSGVPFKEQYLLKYNAQRMLQQERILTSEGGYRTIEYRYPSDSKNYLELVNAHILSPIVEQTVTEDGQSVKEVRTWNVVASPQAQGISPYVQSIHRVFNEQEQPPIYKVLHTDRYGNPLEAEVEGVRCCYIWSHLGTRIIAIVKNASYSDVYRLLGILPEKITAMDYPEAADYRRLEGIRHQLPDSQVFIYKYTPELLLESATLPNGHTMGYRYDYLGNLQYELLYDEAGDSSAWKVKKAYEYQHIYQEVSLIKP